MWHSKSFTSLHVEKSFFKITCISYFWPWLNILLKGTVIHFKCNMFTDVWAFRGICFFPPQGGKTKLGPRTKDVTSSNSQTSLIYKDKFW